MADQIQRTDRTIEIKTDVLRARVYEGITEDGVPFTAYLASVHWEGQEEPEWVAREKLLLQARLEALQVRLAILGEKGEL